MDVTPMIQTGASAALQVQAAQLKTDHVTAVNQPSEELTNPAEHAELREAFTDFVGQTFYSQLLSAMRKTIGKPAYFHGGRAEEVFQGQMDQLLAERLTEASAEQFSEPMFDLFMLPRP